MSHLIKVTTKINNMQSLVAALQRMGCENVETGELKIDYGNTPVHVKVDEYVGFQKQEDGTFACVGDPYYSRSPFKKFYNRNEQLQQTVTTAYTIEDTKRKLEDMNFFLDQNAEGQVGEDGLIHMTAIRYQ